MAIDNPIDDIKALASSKQGFARPNFFSVNFAFPNGIAVDNRELTIMCESASLPGRNINTAEYQAHKQTMKMPYGFLNEDVAFTFLLTSDFFVKKAFDQWLEQIIDTKTYTLKYRDTYATDVTISQLDKNENILYTVRLLKAFPININTIELSNASENTIQRVSVTLTYENYTVE